MFKDGKVLFPEHLPLSDIQRGVKSGKLLQVCSFEYRLLQRWHRLLDTLVYNSVAFFFDLNGFKGTLATFPFFHCWNFLKSSMLSELESFSSFSEFKKCFRNSSNYFNLRTF